MCPPALGSCLHRNRGWCWIGAYGGDTWLGRSQCCLRFPRCVSAVLYLFKWFSASGKRLLLSAPPCCSCLPVSLPVASSLAPCKCCLYAGDSTFKASCSVMFYQASLLAWVSMCSTLQVVGMVEPKGFMLGITTTYVKFRACLVLHKCYQLSGLPHCTSVFSGGGDLEKASLAMWCMGSRTLGPRR